MSQSISRSHPLRRLFSALTEHTFIHTLGLGDPRVTDYLSNLLTRFVHRDAVWNIRSPAGERLEEVAEMMAEAEVPGRSVDSAREIQRHIGDYTLFWTGAFPEALRTRQHQFRKDALIDYHQQGKKAYWIASQYDDEPYREEAPVLRTLSEQFELCAFGLNRVRQEWDRLGGNSGASAAVIC